MNFRRKPPPYLFHDASTDKRPYDLGMYIQWLSAKWYGDNRINAAGPVV